MVELSEQHERIKDAFVEHSEYLDDIDELLKQLATDTVYELGYDAFELSADELGAIVDAAKEELGQDHEQELDGVKARLQSENGLEDCRTEATSSLKKGFGDSRLALDEAIYLSYCAKHDMPSNQLHADMESAYGSLMGALAHAGVTFRAGPVIRDAIETLSEELKKPDNLDGYEQQVDNVMNAAVFKDVPKEKAKLIKRYLGVASAAYIDLKDLALRQEKAQNLAEEAWEKWETALEEKCKLGPNAKESILNKVDASKEVVFGILKEELDEFAKNLKQPTGKKWQSLTQAQIKIRDKIEEILPGYDSIGPAFELATQTRIEFRQQEAEQQQSEAQKTWAEGIKRGPASRFSDPDDPTLPPF